MKWLPLHLRRQVHLSKFEMVKVPLILLINLNFSLEEVGMGLIESKNLKIYCFLGAKAWNCLPTDLRNLTDPKVLSKNFKVIQII